MAKKARASRKVTVTLVKSPIGYNKRQADVVRGLGLRRLGHSVELTDAPSVRGMVHKVRHLVRIEEAEAGR
ncbi:MAG: 50S ribosomal protein L30 [Vicinamibacterales bacterium]|jgi:large subunit ribosomal protein L30|nr:50S ribosomal protein L30 [Acidobacteriota bacterium]MDP6373613.1 50S ribosomal protein L30 [Vicinamibacterales bacterium]MDP6609068.1 50S ribosomal protein L30 [Vicinamibacterales bacterium]HAK54437.1 50S ribosomal protein L30 [Acidobacteriota bacterium]|tara:strand:+ start:1245 stop:1457 length:213 start_codon:yes stop_codon:yes gene_type:complete